MVLELDGATSGSKVVRGNRIGGGILRIEGGAGWQIGGLGAGEGNVLIGPRAVLDVVGAADVAIQGNYLHHDYHGGFSQGFNLWFENGSDGALAEHNVIRGGSWPVQNFGGEFRYNLVVDSGHDFWRGAANGTQIHHNLFVHASGINTGYDGAFKLYGSETGVSVYNNTLDAGGALGAFDGPAFHLDSGTLIESIRNNLFTRFQPVLASWGGAWVSAPGGVAATARVTSADYNGWYNPQAPASTRYLSGIVAAAPGAHDVQADPQLAGAPEVPYRISEGCLWENRCTIGEVLAHYRDLYEPLAASPLLGAGDPADGVNTPIGAIGDATLSDDLFGRVVP